MGLAIVGVDLGTSKLALSVEGCVIYSQPTVVAVRTQTGEVLGTGTSALAMARLEPGEIRLENPVEDGHICDMGLAVALLTRAFSEALRGKLRLKLAARVSVPTMCTTLAKRALAQAVMSAGFRQVDLVPTVVAVAAGTGVFDEEPCGVMVVDIGAGTTDAGIVSMGDAICAESLTLGGQAMDVSVVKMVRAQYGVELSRPSAERLRCYAVRLAKDPSVKVEAVGLRLSDGLPSQVRALVGDVLGAVSGVVPRLIELMSRILHQSGPELVGDIGGKGIILAGGACGLPGLPEAIGQQLGLPTAVAEDAQHACVRGLTSMRSIKVGRSRGATGRFVLSRLVSSRQ